jgi:hypothetical protein
MKKLLLFSAFIVFVFYSCGKTGANPVVAMSATIDGVNENFDTSDSASFHNTATYYSASISSKNGALATSDKMELFIANPTAITVGTYTLTTNYNPPFGPLIIYKTNGGSNFADDYVIDYTGNHPATITITSISKTNIQGTFSGVLVVAAGTSGATKTITNGVFNVDVR